MTSKPYQSTLPRRFVIGDIHGAGKALRQVFNRASFNPDVDLLISLGDICDRWPETDKVIDQLLEIQHHILLLGNHDYWALEWFRSGRAPGIWLSQGGNQTIEAYPNGVPETHVEFLSAARLYFVLENRLFVHGGFPPGSVVSEQNAETLLWDRSLVRTALQIKQSGKDTRLTPYEAVYIGHTPTINLSTTKPVRACEVIMMDTGAGWPGGVLTMMDIDTGAFFQSDPVSGLYP